MNKLNEIQLKSQYLEILGCNIDESHVVEYKTGRPLLYFEDPQRPHYFYEVNIHDFKIGDSLLDIMEVSTLFSPCCGSEVDKDHMLCPTCYEHI